MHHTSDRRRRLLGVGVSLTLHGLAFWGLDRLPQVKLEPIRVATVDFEVVQEKPKPPPAPKPLDPAPGPAPEAETTPERPAPTQPTAYRPPQPGAAAASPDQAQADAKPAGPIDLGTLSASDLGAPDGEGVAVGVPGSGGRRGEGLPRGIKRARKAPPRQVPQGPPAPSYVAAKDLQRAPRAPGLDGTLARFYPPAARAAGISGEARVRIAIEPTGRARVLGVLAESYAGFGSACQRTVQGSHWSAPLDKDGRAVATTLVYRCRFRVDR